MSEQTPKRSIVSSSCAASLIMALYLIFAVFNLYRLMYPLTFAGEAIMKDSDKFVHPLWQTKANLKMSVYLSSHQKFNRDFFYADVAAQHIENGDDEEIRKDTGTVLLWKQDISSPSLSKSFLVTTVECHKSESSQQCSQEDYDPSYQQAKKLLDEAEKHLLETSDGGILSTISAAGQGIESTSILLSLYQSLSKNFWSLLSKLAIVSGESVKTTYKETNNLLERSIVHLEHGSPIWSSLQRNSTVYIHVLVTRDDQPSTSKHNVPRTYQEITAEISRASRSNSLLLGQVDMIKYDEPNHVNPPGRILYRDISYVFRRYILQDSSITSAPWDMKYAKPQFYKEYQIAKSMKENGEGYPYWKPEVAVKYLIDEDSYPDVLAHSSGMQLVRVTQSRSHPTGIAHVPALHVDEIGLTSEKYIPVNGTLTSLPLRISFDRSDMESEHTARSTATAGGISPARWRLLTHLSESIESQKQMGFEQSDIDDLRRLIADTNVTLLAITVLASTLHMLFEFLTFKSEVSFWQNNTDLTGLSVRALFMDMVGQVVIVLYLVEKNSSLLMIVPSVFGCVIALWKCQRAAGFRFVKVSPESRGSSWVNYLPRMLGYELRAVRLEKYNASASSENDQDDLHALTMESDRIAARTLGSVLLPMVLIYAVYSLINEEYTGWYSWLITTASSIVYALGFVLMTPQLFLNYKLKSVAHLPWRVLVYKSLNTFIDDLFSFIIRMPTMARISCFRDDVVFFIYLYQRWLYPVDTSRPVEGVEGSQPTQTSDNADIAKKNQ